MSGRAVGIELHQPGAKSPAVNFGEQHRHVSAVVGGLVAACAARPVRRCVRVVGSRRCLVGPRKEATVSTRYKVLSSPSGHRCDARTVGRRASGPRSRCRPARRGPGGPRAGHHEARCDSRLVGAVYQLYIGRDARQVLGDDDTYIPVLQGIRAAVVSDIETPAAAQFCSATTLVGDSSPYLFCSAGRAPIASKSWATNPKAATRPSR